jgi:hypothetical protein
MSQKISCSAIDLASLTLIAKPIPMLALREDEPPKDLNEAMTEWIKDGADRRGLGDACQNVSNTMNSMTNSAFCPNGLVTLVP